MYAGSLALALAAAPALAWPQTLVGARGGVALTGLDKVGPGPTAGVTASLALNQQLALELAFDQSFHFLPRGTARYEVAGVGGQLRLDVAPAVPYLAVALQASRFSVAGVTAAIHFGGALAVGLLVPLGRRWYAGAEARYGTSLASGALPTSSAFTLSFGWRSGDF